MSLSSAPRWRCVPDDALAWREWDGESVVRNERTGSTHLLAPLAAEILKLLSAAPAGLNSADLATRLADSAASRQADTIAVEEVLREFRRLGLALPEAQ
jgi:PqqD family protein of HPr-rel-A system